MPQFFFPETDSVAIFLETWVKFSDSDSLVAFILQLETGRAREKSGTQKTDKAVNQNHKSITNLRQKDKFTIFEKLRACLWGRNLRKARLTGRKIESWFGIIDSNLEIENCCQFSRGKRTDQKQILFCFGNYVT